MSLLASMQRSRRRSRRQSPQGELIVEWRRNRWGFAHRVQALLDIHPLQGALGGVRPDEVLVTLVGAQVQLAGQTHDWLPEPPGRGDDHAPAGTNDASDLRLTGTMHFDELVVKLQTLLLASAVPASSFAPVVMVAAYVVPPRRPLCGAKLATRVAAS